MRLDHLLSKEKEKRFKCIFSLTKIYTKRGEREIFLLKVEGLLFIFQCAYLSTLLYGDIAQLARAPALQAGGQGFDSLYLHHANIKHSYNMKMFESLDFIASSARNIK